MPDVPRRRVISCIMGGLGNQLFQYAAGLAFAEACHAEHWVDVSEFARHPLRKYELPRFGVDPPTWTGPPLGHGAMGRLRRLRQRMADRGLLPQPRLRLLSEEGFHWQRLPTEGWRDAYLFGYWQSPRYFTAIADRVRRTFDPARFATQELAPLLSELRDERSVSVHVRRGDYASNPTTRAHHGLCEPAWYQQACDIMRKLVPGCRFHVCTDDTAAAREVFVGADDVRVHDARPQEQDLLILRSCRHHIIANSSFSWWAAWLDDRPGSHVIAPRLWFARERMRSISTVDLTPDGWLLL